MKSIVRMIAATFAFMPIVAFAANPVLSTLDPANGATTVSISTKKVSITFDQVVQGSSGNFSLYRKSDGSLLEAAAGTSSSITGTGTTTLTFTFAANLTSNKNYYIQVDNDAVINGSAEAYAGITDTTSWTFRTLGSGKKASMKSKRIQFAANVAERAAQLAAAAEAQEKEAASTTVAPHSSPSNKQLLEERKSKMAPKYNRRTQQLRNAAQGFDPVQNYGSPTGADHRMDRICSRVIRRFGNNPTMLSRINVRVLKRFGFEC